MKKKERCCNYCYNCECVRLGQAYCKVNDNQEVPINTAETCDDFIPCIDLPHYEIEVLTEYWVHHKCPFCGNEDIIYDADSEGQEVIKCKHCGKKYAVDWSIYG